MRRAVTRWKKNENPWRDPALVFALNYERWTGWPGHQHRPLIPENPGQLHASQGVYHATFPE